MERALKRDEDKSRHDLGREEFLKRVWQWRDEKGGKINNQMSRIGASLDWSREAFTMSDVCFCVYLGHIFIFCLEIECCCNRSFCYYARKKIDLSRYSSCELVVHSKVSN